MPQKSKTRKHADIISSLTFDDAGNLTGFENPESVTLPGLEVTGQSIFNGNVGVVGHTVFTGSTIDIKQGGIFLGSDSDGTLLANQSGSGHDTMTIDSDGLTVGSTNVSIPSKYNFTIINAAGSTVATIKFFDPS